MKKVYSIPQTEFVSDMHGEPIMVPINDGIAGSTYPNQPAPARSAGAPGMGKRVMF